jgi:hypothetical protein
VKGELAFSNICWSNICWSKRIDVGRWTAIFRAWLNRRICARPGNIAQAMTMTGGVVVALLGKAERSVRSGRRKSWRAKQNIDERRNGGDSVLARPSWARAIDLPKKHHFQVFSTATACCSTFPPNKNLEKFGNPNFCGSFNLLWIVSPQSEY